MVKVKSRVEMHTGREPAWQDGKGNWMALNAKVTYFRPVTAKVRSNRQRKRAIQFRWNTFVVNIWCPVRTD